MKKIMTVPTVTLVSGLYTDFGVCTEDLFYDFRSPTAGNFCPMTAEYF